MLWQRSYAILDSKENLRFDENLKRCYFFRLLIKETENVFPVFPSSGWNTRGHYFAIHTFYSLYRDSNLGVVDQEDMYREVFSPILAHKVWY